MATYSSVLAWEKPWTEEPGGLQSMGSYWVGHDWSDLARTHMHTWADFTSSCFTGWFFMLLNCFLMPEIHHRLLFFPLALLRCDWHTALCKFRVYSAMVWLTSWNDCHSNCSEWAFIISNGYEIKVEKILLVRRTLEFIILSFIYNTQQCQLYLSCYTLHL